MNNNTILINSYLQNEMTAEERLSFEQKLETDKELQQELHIQQLIMTSITDAGIKAEFAAAARKIRLRRLVRTAAIIIVCIITVLLITSRSSLFEKTGTVAAIQDTATGSHQPFVNPPLPAIDVPFTEYSVDAEKGDTIFHHTGSILYFPPSAFTDEQGNILKGTTSIFYREFSDPLDFFVSGIPMNYDSAGRRYNFESSGMCEITAYQDNKAVFVNKNAAPVIHLSGSNKSDLHNLYFLDTTNRRWEFRGKDKITAVKDLAQPVKIQSYISNENTGLPVKPVRPQKASDNRPAFSIAIDPGSFEELFAYDKLKMEVMDDKNYNREDAEEHWATVKLDHTNAEGIYLITFANDKRKVSYKVRPVLEGADYDAALKVFNEKEKAYRQALAERTAREKRYGDSIQVLNSEWKKKMELERKRNDSLNNLIVRRNKVLREMMTNQVINTDTTALFVFDEQTLQKWAKNANDFKLSSEIVRSFAINRFGTWNCDHPQFPQYEMPLIARYVNESGNNISLSNIAVVYKTFNGITQYQGNSIRVVPGQQNMLWSIGDSTFFYFTYDDFMQTGIQRGTKEFTFKMRKAAQPVTSYNDIRKLVNNL